ncbi:TPA: 5-methylcytosine-specific restriction endonuclease system specificity protein McrC [Staphylococcus aureus]|uniref:5-methylcytosine-specific restriction endonuclease system specificity protein McrC n=1 Tax=Staphylococcus aureus TaxID=1280 RepID=UPI0028DD58D6|nr:5-methylcytosine-specific restriction endonuclease system specificity protein McrC [Staphylococcus aureus]WOL35189.1 5-methylcytosine-specific restriction endonuclease system specificity protein McrC [Staphylococcus aureus]HDL0658509.1 5-methylcytosine-specific restriction endonuclease system specificity protein McrC [Staphylococcus aureus]HEA0021344.1 5-methylcytosine-specific restriction endonuclease system specificity protein McrC [Staphylococcus aureus]HEA0040192.1 5-methylcytosine-speci
MVNIKNIYYMLSYAFTVLNKKGYQKLATEQFENIFDLYSAILIKGISSQLNSGLHHEYLEQTDSLKVVRGKVDVKNSIQGLGVLSQRINCIYDEFSLNTYRNKILKTTMKCLIKTDISRKNKIKLRKLLVHFNNVDTLDYRNIQWYHSFDRNNQTYKMLISICYLIFQGVIQTESKGQNDLMVFVDEQQISRLYEKFILEYYKKEFPELVVTSSNIQWSLDNDDNVNMLPVMRSDIMLRYKDKCLIIDAKFYKNTLNNYYDTKKIHSTNLYQIFTYVKNQQLNLKKKAIQVSGMLLYAKTDENIALNDKFHMSGSQIIIKTLDLNCDFNIIKKQLNGIVNDIFLLK